MASLKGMANVDTNALLLARGKSYVVKNRSGSVRRFFETDIIKMTEFFIFGMFGEGFFDRQSELL